MNISVVKKKNPFYVIFEFISKILKRKPKYIQIPARTSMNYLNKTHKKVDLEKLLSRKQKINSIKDLLCKGEIDISDLTLDEIEELDKLYIEENNDIIRNNKSKLEKITNEKL